MKITWHFEPADIEKVQSFFEKHRDNPFVQQREAVNLADNKPPVTKEDFWERMVACLLTTQQRSGPDSPISRFMTRPFPLRWEICVEEESLADFARGVMADFGGIRRSTIIGKEMAKNMVKIQSHTWESTLEKLDALRIGVEAAVERQTADFIDDVYHGFGPKQSRNLLQMLGLSRYEIPIDSRITKWLNEQGFPVKLTAGPLQDQHYYAFVSDGFQQLASACGIFPCLLDAAIFSSFDGDGWTEDNVVW
ncbi:hypothetical protein [Bremerella sp. P1]|uniref:hypothetical protein n=1 Tax=Bremerella sp. P1 TaxID=3026424 RepID=UPI002368CA5C|nr:hypothetical protein [Bremerella sp. P1]WDI43711.1 hypothetical protein PSR63_07095 [Bremerella sp. P1]